MITCGIDWAEAHHDVALVDDTGHCVSKCKITADPGGLTQLLETIACHDGTPDTTPVAIETEKNLLTVALADAGFTVYPINPRAVARYRERHGQAGAKSDPGDAIVLADILRTDLPRHRPLPAVSDHARTIKVLARQHQEAIWALNQTVSRLRSVLLDYYPQAIQAFPNLKHHAATAVLTAAPTPEAARQLTRDRLVGILHECGRRNDPGLADRILAALQAPGLCQPAEVESGYGLTTTSLLPVITAMRDAVDQLQTRLHHQFGTHPLAPLMKSVPGLGPTLGARILAEVGDDPHRFTTANGLRAFAGTAPVTRASGRSHYVKARKVRNKRLADACHWWAFAALSWSQPARAHYNHRRNLGEHHNAALRNLANKLLGRLWWCLTTGQPWNEHHAWPHLSAPPIPTAA